MSTKISSFGEKERYDYDRLLSISIAYTDFLKVQGDPRVQHLSCRNLTEIAWKLVDLIRKDPRSDDDSWAIVEGFEYFSKLGQDSDEKVPAARICEMNLGTDLLTTWDGMLEDYNNEKGFDFSRKQLREIEKVRKSIKALDKERKKADKKAAKAKKKDQ